MKKQTTLENLKKQIPKSPNEYRTYIINGGKKYGEVEFSISKPSLETIGKALPYTSDRIGKKKNIMLAGETILMDCFSGGDERVKTVDALIEAAAYAVVVLLNDIKDFTIVNVDDLEASGKIGLPDDTQYILEVDGKRAYLKYINRHIKSEAMNHIHNSEGNPNFIKSGILIFNACVINSDLEFRMNDDFILAAVMACNSLVEMLEVELKKS